MADSFDVVILGGGPGGYVAAIRAAQLGKKTAVVEREHLGGICLNWGCIPTKALLRAAEVYETIANAAEFGIEAGKPSFDVAKLVRRSRKVAERLSRGVGSLMKKHSIEVIEGSGRLAGPGRVQVTAKDGATREVEAANIVVATGARPRPVPGLEPDGKVVWTYKEAMVPKTMPSSILVVGAGAIGIEFASFYRSFGAEVTVVEMMDRILPVEDAEISEMAAKAFKRRGIGIRTTTRVAGLSVGDDGRATAVLESNVGANDKRGDGSGDGGNGDRSGDREEITVERVLVAAGIVGNTEELGLEDAGVTIDRGHIVVDGFGRTGVEGLWAIGDVTGPPWLAHKAMHEGVLAAEAMAGHAPAHGLDATRIPGCTYSSPQVASVGLTEQAARDAGHEVRVGRFPFAANGKALALGESQGLVKTVFDATTGELLGAHMIGAEVTELIGAYTVARTLETTEAELAATVFPHPTLSEMLHESVLDAFERALHI